MDINNLKDFQECLEKSWSGETSEYPEKWSKDNPASGHCLISAFIFQDSFGGEILEAKLGGLYPYYWNRLPNGTEIELTRSQLPENVVVPPGKIRRREALERALRSAHPDVLYKYKILKAKVEKLRA